MAENRIKWPLDGTIVVYGTIGGIFYGEKDIGPSAGIWDGGELLQPAGDDMAGTPTGA